ncbi:two-component system regulatory protein YycI [Apilactobacillus apisilvae]|uniref:Two-component system regulatory protein YycI n=1 Tax=Apilactobacillus apisilvae TaxID=2923364 RepID=A0ABY4PFQ9_9LACO|nr:two-component system regulatory protein YycI [Apilactobacillus apisilvae]UQS84634.1 two-component system regulatory protein YycI [Apilactobacillus apisilvae]
MDFKKIQLIFLVIFVMIDIFLFSMFHQNASLQSENINQGNDSDIVKQMQNDQINIKPNLSENKLTGYYLSATLNNSLEKDAKNLDNQKTSYSNNILRSNFKRQIYISDNIDDTVDKLNQLIKQSSFVSHGNDYEYSKSLSNSNAIVYLQKAEDRHVYSSTRGKIQFDISDDHLLTGYTQSYLDDIKILREKSDVISKTRSLVWLYQYNEIPNNSKINWIHLYYTRLLSIKDNQVLIPTWVISFNTDNSSNETIKRINAYTGAILDGSGSTKSASESVN